MSDAAVAEALRSSARLVVVEAPAGCGKTFQGAQYASEIAEKIERGRVLILTHTHAASDVFASRTQSAKGRVDSRTIDSFIGQIAGAYHLALDLPTDTGSWARSRKGGYGELAAKVANLLSASPMVVQSLARRYPIVIFDEHQDASADQHALALACHAGGMSVRVFGDPMQRIYGSRKKQDIEADDQRWSGLKQLANAVEELDDPHRWSPGADHLGRWILAARAALRAGGQVDLRGTLPPGVSLVIAENQSPRRGTYILENGARKPVDAAVKAASSLLVLAAQNDTVDALRAFFGRRLPIWEGHVRESLAELLASIQGYKGDAVKVTEAALTFLSRVATGFSRSQFGETMLEEASNGCTAQRRGKPAQLQALARVIVERPDHVGVANMLDRLNRLIASESAFDGINIDYRREYWDAMHLGRFEDPEEGFSEIARRRSYARPTLPTKAISTVHKAKGLECENVIIMPCDAQHFGDTLAARCRLYVAMSRATRSLTLVAPRTNPSPLLAL